MAISGFIKRALRKAVKPKSKKQQLNERIKKAQKTKGIKGAKEEFKARDEKKAFEKRRLERIKKEQEIKKAKEKAKRKGKGAIQTTKPKSFKQAVKEAGAIKKGLKIKLGGKGKSAKAKPVGTPEQRAKAAERRMELKLDRIVEEAMQKRIDAMGEPKFKKGGTIMPMKKKSKMMARGGMKKSKMMARGGMKKSKMMARGGMKKKSKMMAKGGMKKSKMYARGGAARRR